MKTKLRRHYRSAVSVLLSVCMLISCMTVGLIATDAAKVDGESVGVNGGTLWYSLNGATNWSSVNLSSGDGSITLDSAQSLEFNFSFNDIQYKKESSGNAPTGRQASNYSFYAKKEAGGGNSLENFYIASLAAGTYNIHIVGNDGNQITFNFYKAVTEYAITTISNGNGSLTSSLATAAKDAEVTLTAAPDRGYILNTVTIAGDDGTSVASTVSGNNVLFTMPAQNVTATASFTTNPNSYTITANQVAEGGTLKIALKNGTKAVGAEIADTTAAKTLTAYSGETLTISAVHGSGYKLKKLTVTDGSGTHEYTDQTSVTINPVTSNVTATAEFEEGETLPNDYTAEKGSTITDGEANGSIFANIKATFYDYYTDGEVAGGWYKGINAQTEGWIGGISERNPYKTLNSALSEYAKDNRVQYPLYFGSFYVTSYQDPNYYHSAATYYGDRINDSNALGGATGHNSWALPGLAGSSLSGGNVYYTNGTNGDNGAQMKLFDKEWLSSRGGSTEAPDTITLEYSDTYNWSVNGSGSSAPTIIAVFRVDWNTDEYFVKMTNHSDTKTYTCSIPSGYNDKTVEIYFLRYESNKTIPPEGLHSHYTWPERNDEASATYSKTIHTYTLTGWKSCVLKDLPYTGPLASFMNTSFPVYKRTQEGATYYEFDSSSAHYDTVYFSDLNFDNPSGSTPQIQFSTGDVNKSIMNGFNSGVGFFPFDRYDVNKRSGYSNRYGKDLATGMKLEFKFTLGKNASGQEGYILKNGADGDDDSDYVAQKFNFSGDDDLWVYVDDNLILDLGGDHSKTTGTIDFAQKKVTGVTADTVLTAEQSITRNGSFTLADKRVHTMTIYYMERGMHESNLKFGFSMSPLATDFSTEKEVDASKLNAGIGMYDASTNTNGFIDTFEFTNTSYDADGTTVNDHSKSKAYKYFKWDSAQNKYDEQLGSYSSDGTGKFSLTSDPTKQYADFDNKLKVNDVLRVTETSQKGYHYNTTYEILDEEYLVENAPDLIKAGSGTDTGKFIFKTIMPNADVNTDVTNIRVKFLNELKTQTVYVKKEIKNDYLTADSFEIQVGLKMVNGGTQTILNTAGLKYKSDDDNYVTEKSLDRNGKCSIRQDETLRFEGIPEGATVTITETPKTGYTIDSIAHSESNNTLSYTSGAYTASVVLNKIDTITITNEKLFDLKIKKELTGESAPAGTYFPIMVSVKQPGGMLTPITVSNYANYTYDVATMPTSAGTGNANDVYFDTSTGYFMLKPGEDFTIKSFKKDTEFTVAEKTDAVANCIYDSMVVDGSQTAAADYTDSANNLSGKQGIKIGAKDITVTVNNAMMLKKTLTITKKLTSGTDASTAFTDASTAFTVAVTLDGNAYQGAWKLNDTAQTDTTTGVFTVHQDDKITIENIPVNSTMVVSETNIPFNYTLSKITVGSDTDTDVKGTPTNGYTFDIADDTDVSIWNAPITYHYSITYAYDSYRDLHKTQKYKVTGDFDNNAAIVADYLKVSNTVYDDATKGNVTAYWFKDDNARKNFINILGPYENNYRQKLYWNTDMKTESNSEGVSIVYNSSNHTYTIDVNVIASSQKFVDLTFKLPYNHDTRDTAYAATETDGKVLYNNALPDETISNLDYGTWFASNGVKYGESGKPQFVSAPLVIYDGTQAKGFKYWTVKTVATDLAPSVEYTKCYYHEFNLSIYQDSIVEPHYENITAEEAANYSHNAHEEAIKPGNANGAVVTFIENSRNQYNMRNENIKQSSRKQQGDRIYTDFLLSYASESDLKFQDYPNGTYTAGLAIQKVALLDDDGVNGKITDSAHYATKYGANLGEMKYNGVAFDKTTLESFIKGNADYNDAIGLERSEFDANKLDNKNRIQYYYSYSVRSHTDLTDNGNKDYVYRAFAYMKDNSGNVTMVSQPLYFTFYDMASIANAQIGYNADFPSTPTP